LEASITKGQQIGRPLAHNLANQQIVGVHKLGVFNLQMGTTQRKGVANANANAYDNANANGQMGRLTQLSRICANPNPPTASCPEGKGEETSWGGEKRGGLRRGQRSGEM
jgi:hypothetical protein